MEWNKIDKIGERMKERKIELGYALKMIANKTSQESKEKQWMHNEWKKERNKDWMNERMNDTKWIESKSAHEWKPKNKRNIFPFSLPNTQIHAREPELELERERWHTSVREQKNLSA